MICSDTGLAPSRSSYTAVELAAGSGTPPEAVPWAGQLGLMIHPQGSPYEYIADSFIATTSHLGVPVFASCLARAGTRGYSDAYYLTYLVSGLSPRQLEER